MWMRRQKIDENADRLALVECGRSVGECIDIDIGIAIGNVGHTCLRVLGDTVLLALGQCVQFGPVHLIQVMFPLVKLYGTNKTL